MHHLIRALAVVPCLLLLSCDPNTALDRVCDPGATQCISLSKFQSNLDTTLNNGGVVGYVTVVGGLPDLHKYGYARTGADKPQLAWDSDVPINVMSLAKVFTTVAVLQVMAKNDIQLTDTISGYLPSDWSQGSNINLITFQDLLTHRSGFNQNTGGASAYSNLQAQIASGVSSAGYGQPLYDNNNFAIFRVLLPYMDNWKDPGADTRDAATTAWYVNYMQENVFKKVGITDATTVPTGPHGYWYSLNPTDSSAGDDGGDWTSLVGGGGWSMSMGSLYKFLLALQTGNQLLTDDQKATMDSTCLGWDCSVQTQNDYVGKNGSWSSNGRRVWTFFGLFHQRKVMALAIVNSPTGSPDINITTIMANAFANSWVAKE
ncbi:MAG TPA: serine hydrolase domain-containing protein [Archangium sp.]|nr:serine hydrolase domain-containing protein [Archangium sp.]